MYKQLCEMFANAQRIFHVQTWRKYSGFSAYFYERHTVDKVVICGFQLNLGFGCIRFGV